MSLYNTLFGVHPAADALLSMLGIERHRVPRFRDCFLKGDTIVIYTRTGGGNREFYARENDSLRIRKGYIADVDMAFDSTYALFSYAIPAHCRRECETIRDLFPPRDPGADWPRLLAKMGDPAMRNDPEVAAALEKSRPIMDKLAADMAGDKAVRIIDV